jgi:hypothetical protein
MNRKTADEILQRLNDFMKAAAIRVAKWPEWKRNTGYRDCERQYDRHEPRLSPDNSQESENK